MVDIKPRSRDVTDGLERAPARGMLRAVGMGDEDFAKPQIGIASSWNEITPCNLSLERLARSAKEGVHAAGGFPLQHRVRGPFRFATRSGGDLTLKAVGEIVIDASRITLVAGGAALVLEGGAVNAAPVLNVGSASPAAAALPAIPAILQAAAGEGSPFVSHCPNAAQDA